MNSVEFFFLFADRNTGLYQPHLGSDYLISLLNARGYKASRIMTCQNEMLLDVLVNIKHTKKNNIQYVFGFTCYDANYQMVKHGIGLVKDIFPDSIIFVGGPSASFNDDVLLTNIRNIDLCFLGESEVSILEFAKRLTDGVGYQGISNTSYLKDNTVINTGKNCVLDERSINEFPSAICTPMYDPEEILRRYGKISIITSRGCPHRCSFCAFSLQSNHTVRYYKCERVIDEIKYIDSRLRNISNVENKRVVIEDDCFTLNKEHFWGITDEIIKLKPHLTFECQTRADYLDWDILKQLKKAGFYRVDISLESSNAEVLVANKKVATFSKAIEYIDKVRKVINWCRELSIECYTTLICGLPGDTQTGVKNTHEFIINNNPGGYYWNNLKVFTGTSLFSEYMSDLIDTRDENLFNPVCCNNITYNQISPYHPKQINRLGDDVSWKDRKQRTKEDVFEYLTGEKVSNSRLFRLNMPIDFKQIIKQLIVCLPLDTRILLFKEEAGFYYINSIILSELQAVALFDNNLNDDIYATLTDISPTIRLETNELLLTSESLSFNHDFTLDQIMKLTSVSNICVANTKYLKVELLDILIALNNS